MSYLPVDCKFSSKPGKFITFLFGLEIEWNWNLIHFRLFVKFLTEVLSNLSISSAMTLHTKLPLAFDQFLFLSDSDVVSDDWPRYNLPDFFTAKQFFIHFKRIFSRSFSVALCDESNLLRQQIKLYVICF